MGNGEIKFQILFKLYRKDYWECRMINFSDLIKVAPRNKRKLDKIMIKDLCKDGLLNKKPGIKYEFRYSLRIDRKKDIEKILEEFIVQK